MKCFNVKCNAFNTEYTNNCAAYDCRSDCDNVQKTTSIQVSSIPLEREPCEGCKNIRKEVKCLAAELINTPESEIKATSRTFLILTVVKKLETILEI